MKFLIGGFDLNVNQLLKNDSSSISSNLEPRYLVTDIVKNNVGMAFVGHYSIQKKEA